MADTECFYFGSLQGDGHFLYSSSGHRASNSLAVVDGCSIDGSLAPRRIRYGSRSYYNREDPSPPVCWTLQAGREDRNRLAYDSAECVQGQFLLHALPNGFTTIAWWDRCQGDSRPGSNSAILLRGVHTAEEMLAAGKQHFPLVFRRLERAGVVLVDVNEPELFTSDSPVISCSCATDVPGLRFGPCDDGKHHQLSCLVGQAAIRKANDVTPTPNDATEEP
jgi:hypothetical protein